MDLYIYIYIHVYMFFHLHLSLIRVDPPMIAPCNDMEPTLRIHDVSIERGRKTLHEKK